MFKEMDERYTSDSVLYYDVSSFIASATADLCLQSLASSQMLYASFRRRHSKNLRTMYRSTLLHSVRFRM